MRLIKKNGGSSAPYEHNFKNTTIFYENEKVEYKLCEDDMSSSFITCANLEYQAKFGDVNAQLLEYYLFFNSADEPILRVVNGGNLYSVMANVELSESERAQIKSITVCSK